MRNTFKHGLFCVWRDNKRELEIKKGKCERIWAANTCCVYDTEQYWLLANLGLKAYIFLNIDIKLTVFSLCLFNLTNNSIFEKLEYIYSTNINYYFCTFLLFVVTIIWLSFGRNADVRHLRTQDIKCYVQTHIYFTYLFYVYISKRLF